MIRSQARRVIEAGGVLAVCWLALGPALVAAPELPPDPPELAPEADTVELPPDTPELAPPPFNVVFGNRVAEILEALKEHYPEIVEPFDPRREDELLKRMTAAFPGVEYLTAAEAAARGVEVPPPNGGPYPGVIVAAQKVLYVRLDDLAPATVTKVVEDVVSSARLVRPPVGVVLDLRDCGGSDYAGAARVLRLFGHPVAGYGDAHGESRDDRPVRLPVMVMVGGNTAGAAEVLAALLERDGNALTMGQRTAGRPFASKPVTLNNGDVLLVPDLPAPLRQVPPTAINPSVAAQSGPQIAYAKLSGTAGGYEEDASLQRAVDLLLSLHALQQRAPAKK